MSFPIKFPAFLGFKPFQAPKIMDRVHSCEQSLCSHDGSTFVNTCSHPPASQLPALLGTPRVRPVRSRRLEESAKEVWQKISVIGSASAYEILQPMCRQTLFHAVPAERG